MTPSPEVQRQHRLYGSQRPYLRITQIAVMAVLILVVVGPTAAKGIANLAHFNSENGVYPHD